MTTPATTPADLLPCPFCGSHNEEIAVYKEIDSTEWFVRCHVCHVETVRLDTEAESIRAWNRRATPSFAYPCQPFAIVTDRTYSGEGPTLAVWNGENYNFSDGDCFDREFDGTLDGYDAEWLTHYQLEQRLFATPSPDQTKATLAAMVDAVRWWAKQEDGMPAEVAPAFNAAMLALGWSYSQQVDLDALATPSPGKADATAKQRYDEFMREGEEPSPIERLRFFCSLAMHGQDWLDVEPFFDAIQQARDKK